MAGSHLLLDLDLAGIARPGVPSVGKIQKANQERGATDDAVYDVSAFRQARRLNPYRTMQNKFAGMKPNCEVRYAITHTMALLIPARIQPFQHLLPTGMVETTVSTEER
jgi:hypothetical protein